MTKQEMINKAMENSKKMQELDARAAANRRAVAEKIAAARAAADAEKASRDADLLRRAREQAKEYTRTINACETITHADERAKKIADAVRKATPLNVAALHAADAVRKNGMQSADAAAAIYALADIIIFSRIKNIQKSEATYHPMNERLRLEVCMTRGDKINRMIESMEDLYEYKLNANGDAVAHCTDADAVKEILRRVAVADADAANGQDLRQTVALAIVTDAAAVNAASMPIDYFISLEEKCNKRGEVYYTNKIREYGKLVSEFINGQRKVGASEFPLDAVANENGELVYKRAHLFAIDNVDISGASVECVNTAAEMFAREVEKAAAFTASERAVYYALLNKQSMEEIARKQGYSVRTIQRTRVSVQEKILACGIVAAKTADDANGPHAVTVKRDGVTVGTFESVGKAAAAVGVCKSSASECANGKRKTAGGYTFTFAK